MSTRPVPGPSASAASPLVRAIGRWSLTALALNVIIGSGIFGLPDDIARRVGPAAPLAYVIAALGIAVVVACFAEVASRFQGAGGPYLYAREAFGRLAGLETGWFAWLVRITSAAANANLFVAYAAQFFPAATDPLVRALLLLLLIGFLATINVRGVQSGTSLSNAFAIAKLVLIAVFVAAGFYFVGGNIHVGASPAPRSDWLQAILTLMFAYGGFEAALMPMSEARDPRRDAPIALFTALGIAAVVYVLIHLVVMGAIPDLATIDRPEVRERPVAEAARVFLGSTGATLIAIGVMVSAYGNLAGQFIASPRLTFALAEQRDFPAFFARVHPRFLTPHVSILVHAVLVASLAIAGSFIFNAVLSAAARVLTYAVVCAAVPALRRRAPGGAAFHLAGGWIVPVIALLFCAVIAANMDLTHLGVIGAVALAAAINWAAITRRA